MVSNCSRVKVTELANGEVCVYDYSNVNWANRWACMLNGNVVMWTPSELRYPHTTAVITSGRRWELVNDYDQ